MTLSLAAVQAPEIDYQALAPLMATVGGSIVVLMVGLFRGRLVQTVLVPALAAIALLAAIGLTIWNWEPGDVEPIIEGAMEVDTLALGLSMLFYVAGLVCIVLSLRALAAREAGHGEYHSLLLGSITGMIVLAQSSSLMTLFVGIELLSIPLYVLCATELRRRTSLESGLKYLVIGSVGSATLLYGLALIYGATGALQFDGIAAAIAGDELSATDPLLLTGIALTATGLAFKASVAPFHQWTPDVYEGAPTPITTFMAVATKAAAFAIFLRLFGGALGLSQLEWGPALAVLAAFTIIVGNVGRDRAALAQAPARVVERGAGRLPAGGRGGGLDPGPAGDGLLPGGLPRHERRGVRGRPRARAGVRAWRRPCRAAEPRHQPALARVADDHRDAVARRVPATAGFIGKFYLIDASVAGDYTWLGILIVIGSVISLAYYLRVVAVMWMGRVEVELPTVPPRRVRPVSGWSPEADLRAQPEVAAIAILFAAATILFGIWPDPLFDAARDMGTSISSLR